MTDWTRRTQRNATWYECKRNGITLRVNQLVPGWWIWAAYNDDGTFADGYDGAIPVQEREAAQREAEVFAND